MLSGAKDHIYFQYSFLQFFEQSDNSSLPYLLPSITQILGLPLERKIMKKVAMHIKLIAPPDIAESSLCDLFEMINVTLFKMINVTLQITIQTSSCAAY